MKLVLGTGLVAAALLLPTTPLALHAQNEPGAQENQRRQENQRGQENQPAQANPRQQENQRAQENQPAQQDRRTQTSQRGEQGQQAQGYQRGEAANGSNARYHDRERNDDHQWNESEDRAYRTWAQENHRRYQDFNKLDERDQAAYWAWRHNHADAETDRDRNRDSDRDRDRH